MKNILLFTTSLANGGAERFVITHYKILKDLGYNVYIVASNEIIELGEINKDNYYSLHNSKGLFNVMLKPYRLYRFIKKEKINLIIDNRTKLNFFKTIIYERCFVNIKKIKIIHNYNTKKYLFDFKWVNDNLFKKYDMVVCVSKAIKEKVNRETSFNNIHFIYNPIPEINLIQTDKEFCNSKYILFYGRFENKSKNLFFLIDAYRQSELPLKNIRLFLMGKGKDQFMIEQKIQEFKLQNSVEILSQRSQPFGVVSNALFTVMTSHYEGFPMTIVESLSLGIPVVCSNFQSGPAELIVHEQNGLIVNQNIPDFTTALNRMVSDKKLYERCCQNAKNSVRHLSATIIQKQWKKLIEEIT